MEKLMTASEARRSMIDDKVIVKINALVEESIKAQKDWASWSCDTGAEQDRIAQILKEAGYSVNQSGERNSLGYYELHFEW